MNVVAINTWRTYPGGFFSSKIIPVASYRFSHAIPSLHSPHLSLSRRQHFANRIAYAYGVPHVFFFAPRVYVSFSYSPSDTMLRSRVLYSIIT